MEEEVPHPLARGGGRGRAEEGMRPPQPPSCPPTMRRGQWAGEGGAGEGALETGPPPHVRASAARSAGLSSSVKKRVEGVGGGVVYSTSDNGLVKEMVVGRKPTTARRS